MTEIESIIARLQLEPHPEGGFFKETYRSSGEVDFNGVRNYSTCIYFLLTSDTFSAFHRIRQDEIWHFYAGSPIELYQISPTGEYHTVLIGNNFENGEVPQYVVPAGYWFGATVHDGYALVGCTVSPGFDFMDFELAKREDLLSLFPEHDLIICKLTR